MADHSKPTLTSNYSSFVTELDGRFDDLAAGLDPAVITATNVPTNSIRWSSAVNKWQKYNGTSWADLTATYNISISGNSATVTNGVYTTGSYANPTWITSLAGSKITGDIAGNAGSATKLATARNINGVAFDGTAAISINTNNSATFNNSGTGATSGSTFNGSSSLTVSYNTIGAPSVTGANASGTWGISITGNAATATNPASGGTFITSSNISSQSVNFANTSQVCNTTIGVGQSWQTLSMANNTTYTNTTGRTVVITIRCNANGGYGWTDQVFVNNNQIAGGTYDAAVVGATYYIIVPNNATYRVNFPTGIAAAWILS